MVVPLASDGCSPSPVSWSTASCAAASASWPSTAERWSARRTASPGRPPTRRVRPCTSSSTRRPSRPTSRRPTSDATVTGPPQVPRPRRGRRHDPRLRAQGPVHVTPARRSEPRAGRPPRRRTGAGPARLRDRDDLELIPRELRGMHPATRSTSRPSPACRSNCRPGCVASHPTGPTGTARASCPRPPPSSKRWPVLPARGNRRDATRRVRTGGGRPRRLRRRRRR